MDENIAAMLEELMLRVARMQQGIDDVGQQLRIGNVIATIEANERKLERYLQQARVATTAVWFTGGLPSPEQEAAMEEWETPDGTIASIRERIDKQRAYVVEQLGLDMLS